ncbi:hypothetical protein HOLleu_31883 [Holothuria leucospilota]|uniref:Uncharacterized protein n=1 Tax=Holothuria leucospilota TaxID=206669 RepID=A0A9Q1BHK3_HOLLE|nr:hypothetical protein HOLleu_31883 [Holothuria leucospilota]
MTIPEEELLIGKWFYLSHMVYQVEILFVEAKSLKAQRQQDFVVMFLYNRTAIQQNKLFTEILCELITPEDCSEDSENSESPTSPEDGRGPLLDENASFTIDPKTALDSPQSCPESGAVEAGYRKNLYAALWLLSFICHLGFAGTGTSHLNFY